jgi:glycosyltransferase involved in cell wall biosynthesis
MSTMEDPPRLQGRDIVCVGFADWDTELQTNQHHLMKRLARDNRVLFVESLGLRRPQLAGRDLKRIARRLRKGLRGVRELDGVHVLSPLVLPLHGSRLARALNARLLTVLVRRAARRLRMHNPILWGYVPQAQALVGALAPELVIYHCVDDIAAQPGIDAASFRAAEARFAARAELVLASSPALAERMRGLSPNVLYAPNVADTELFAGALSHGPIDPAVAALPRPRVVFTGAVVATKIDMDLLHVLALSRRDWSFVLVGPVGAGDPRTDVSGLAAQPNVHLLGRRTYEQLPSVLRGADAGIIPYARNPLTAGIFPMKVYEYLAAGLPVVATPLPSLAGVGEVATAPDAQGIAALLDRALATDTRERRVERSRAARAHSWERRIEEIAAAITALAQDGAVESPQAGSPPQASTPEWDLLVTTHTPSLRSGRDLRTYGIARALAAQRPLTLLYVRFGAARPDASFAQIRGVEMHEVVASRGVTRARAYICARARGVPDGFARGVSAELARAAAQLARTPGCRRVIADGPTAFAALAHLARERPVVYNAHNLESGFRHELGGGEARRLRGLRAFERGVLRRAGESWMVSDADVDGARELCPSARLRLVPNVVDVTAIEPVARLAPERRAIFVANFAYEPNRNALGFLLERVLPRVWEELPEARLLLVGGGLERPPSEDPRVEAAGFVADLAPAYRRSRCAVVPLLQGGGSPLKLVEALAYGLPVLATPRAVAGLGVHPGEDCLIADGEQAFADALVGVLREGAPEVARRGRALARERYSIEALAALLRA